MRNPDDFIVIGIGSHHGDDALGWLVVDRLEACHFEGACFRKLQNPLSVLDVLDRSEAVHVVDATAGMNPAERVRRLRFANLEDRESIRQIHGIGTHDASIYLALCMAEPLGMRTDHVTIWLGNGQHFKPNSELSTVAIESIDCCCEALIRELYDA